MNALFFAQAEELSQELGLHQRFAAGGCHAACSYEVLVAQDFLQQFFRCKFTRAFSLIVHPFKGRTPGIGIVTELASERASLKKYHESDARSVNGPEGF